MLKFILHMLKFILNLCLWALLAASISWSKFINFCLDTAAKRCVPVGEWLPKNTHCLLQHVRFPRFEEDIQSFFIADPRGKAHYNTVSQYSMCIAEPVGMITEEKGGKAPSGIRVLSLEVSRVECWVSESLWHWLCWFNALCTRLFSPYFVYRNTEKRSVTVG